MAKVLNARQVGKLTPAQVYVGRGTRKFPASKWGNKFVIGRDGDAN
jgi:hypothetical protein